MKNLIILIALVMTNGCALPDKDKTPQAPEKVGQKSATPQASIEAKQLGAENEAKQSVEIKFVKGKAKPGPQARKKLEKITKTNRPEDIKKIMILTWSDKPKAPGAQELAEKRADSLATYFKDYKVSKHNMTEEPGKIAKWLGTEDARVKKSLADSMQGSTKVSSAMILVIPKE